MRIPTIKRCIYFALICALLLIFRLTIKDYEGADQQIGPVRTTEIDSSQHLKPPSSSEPTSAKKLWFFRNGELYPSPAMEYSRNMYIPYYWLLPDLRLSQSDRIVNQLMYVPDDYGDVKASRQIKTILLYNGLLKWNVTKGRDVFVSDKCPVDTCQLTDDMGMVEDVDMILYKDRYTPTAKVSSVRRIRALYTSQITMLYNLECPFNTLELNVPNAINWTASYRRDSSIVTPYSKWVYYDDNVQQRVQDRNYAENKTKKVAWFVSNCNADNGRLEYALELQQHIEVDIYGACGKLKCSRVTPEKCFKLLETDYKFYLAFENSNCKDYISEKYLVNALDRGVLPIVMGAHPQDYAALAPHDSYIHVDNFGSPKDLAEYLMVLDADDDLYNSYFLWKGTGEFINTHFWCRVCAMLHNKVQLKKPYFYKDYNDWWGGPNVCTKGTWNNFTKVGLDPSQVHSS
ncbi:glycoprotein 3-alpha-L-fucosyltransferase A-like [Drosophila guanche]|uniref:Fucosyltransferase n=1 Tax=Drosophila guanche TaxID=7266 RepID=A0A3B0K1L8_DROGU|nr:glycoprotein 3-alpha-L-fucosyltransferase A-like [Drosophila guanche]SPP78911.1 blast:Glycoprotein 3-alpha-L-fucosyltransferase A [Drosophila guanche]